MALLRDLWKRLPFVGRLLATASVALVAAGAAMLLVLARQEVTEFRSDLATELATDLDTLPAALSEIVVVGDYATLQQALDHNVSHPPIVTAEFRDAAGNRLRSDGDRPKPNAPGWFVALFDISDLSGAVPIAVGGHYYGDLSLTLTAQGLADRSWDHLQGHLAVLLLAIGLDFVGIWLVLRAGLGPLKELEIGANAMAAGNLRIQIMPRGSPEIRHVIEVFNRMAKSVLAAQADLKQTEEQVRRMAFYDQLTNLPNRRLLEDRLNQLITQAERARHRMSLLYIDLDKFKPINDDMGHEVGDWLLRSVAQRMQGCLRKSDTVARIGGDEFVALLPDTGNFSDATSAAEKIRAALNVPFVAPNGKSIEISSSIGIALYPDHADNMRDLLRLGDEAMYRAKNAGRNTVAL